MNPLGWQSAIYTLDHGMGAPMGEVADTLLHDVRGLPMATLAGDQLIAGLGVSRELYGDALDVARGGADEATVIGAFDDLVGSLHATEHVGVTGAAIGHVSSARRAAEQVVANLRGGIGPGEDATHEALWRLRNHLHEGWEAIGTAKVMGELRGLTSA